MRNIVTIVLGSVIIAVGFNLFIIPHQHFEWRIKWDCHVLGIVTPINTGILNLY